MRNAPGLFSTRSGENFYAVANRADGSAVSLERPARAGETVTLYGTGFGPPAAVPPDGYAVDGDRYRRLYVAA